ncbi:hypothetical protein ED28_02535 [[Pantoea] beijingensis]|uniref:Uncharacterized protein n=1 Tax=[Pantoea] beijingensis TaxID=1324864 RepID=A0A443IIA2_9GAMM|nr:hypothetical protein [[Pantoea] beijingensis]RWR03884.1 hypothetical protein ED28_02535 [[Pantoea] beijingensis]
MDKSSMGHESDKVFTIAFSREDIFSSIVFLLFLFLSFQLKHALFSGAQTRFGLFADFYQRLYKA